MNCYCSLFKKITQHILRDSKTAVFKVVELDVSARSDARNDEVYLSSSGREATRLETVQTRLDQLKAVLQYKRPERETCDVADCLAYA